VEDNSVSEIGFSGNEQRPSSRAGKNHGLEVACTAKGCRLSVINPIHVIMKVAFDVRI
jgi:hypothetical protein